MRYKWRPQAARANSERQWEGIFLSRNDSRARYRAIKMGPRNEFADKVIVILSPCSPESVPVPTNDKMGFFNGNANRILPSKI